MKLNRIEKLIVNSPARRLAQQYFEVPILERLGGRTQDQRVLEIGCGRGVGTETILNRFGASEVVAIDLDPDQVQRARRRLGRYDGRATAAVADVSRLNMADGSFDAAFAFLVLHHVVPDWRKAVGEIARVIRPGGRFYFYEPTRQAIDRWPTRWFLHHPPEGRFEGEEFIGEVERRGMAVGERRQSLLFGDYIMGVAVKV